MTKLSNIPAKETTAKTAKTRKAKTEPAKPQVGSYQADAIHPRRDPGTYP